MSSIYMGDKLPKKELIRLLKELYKQVDILAGKVKILEAEILLLKSQNLLRPDPNRRPYTPPNVPWYKIPPVTCDAGQARQAGQFIEDMRNGDLVPNVPDQYPNGFLKAVEDKSNEVLGQMAVDGGLAGNRTIDNYKVMVDPITSDARSVSMADPKRQMGNSYDQVAKVINEVRDLMFPDMESPKTGFTNIESALKKIDLDKI